MKKIYGSILLAWLSCITVLAQKEIPTSITTKIELDLENKIFKIGHENNKEPIQYYDMDFNPITKIPFSSKFETIAPGFYPTICCESSCDKIKEIIPEMKGNFLITYKFRGRYDSHNELIGFFVIQYYSETENVTSVKNMSVVYSSYSIDMELLTRKIYPLSFVVRGNVVYMNTSTYFIDNCTYVDENTYFVDTYSGVCLLLDENFELKSEVQWGKGPYPELPKEYVYLFKKWKERITETPRLLRRFGTGPKNGLARPGTILNYYVYNIWGEVYLRVRWFSEFYFVKI